MALGPPRPADTVYVVLILLRHVEVEDGVHIVHVDAPAGHVRGHEHMELALPELGHDLLPLLLGDISVDALGVQPTHLQKLRQPLRGALGVAEADDPLQPLLLDDGGNGVHLGVGVHIEAVLQNIGLILLRGLHRDLLRIPLIDPRDIHHLTGDGGGEHPQILPVGDLVQYPPHIVDKAHIQHPVRLIQHHGGHLVQHHRPPLHVVGEPPRRGHHDLGPPLQGVDLLADRLTSVQAHQPHPLVAHRHLPHLLGDLHGQLTGGGQDHRLHRLALRVDALDDGDAEGHGLTGAGRGLGDHVLPRQHGGDAPGLYGGAHFISFVVYGTHGRLRQPEALEGCALCNVHSVVLVFVYFQP